ncbi:MAG: divergent PAP2 family protein [Sphaerochaetaceae bacterium]
MNILLANRPLFAALLAAFIAQLLKPFLQWPFEKKFLKELFISTGGMPSSHTAMVVALATSVFLVEGGKSLPFAVTLTFALIIIHDSMGIRRAAGKQAKVLNDWSRILNQIHEDGQFTIENLKTMLGHSFMQVLGGILLGLLCGFFVSIY